MIETHEHTLSRFHKALAESIEHAVEFGPGMIVTLVRGEITGDARYAKGTISVLPESKTRFALKQLKKNEREIKQQLNKRLRLRVTPQLNWGVDSTEITASEIEKILNELEKTGGLGEDEE